MFTYKWLNLQLFAGEGTGGEGAGDASGENGAVDPGQQRLLELGVPADKIRNRAKRSPAKPVVNTAPQEEQKTEEQAAAVDSPTEEKTDAPARMSWDDIMKDPEYNEQMQAVVRSRLRSAKGAEESLAKLTPALEVLARKYNLDPENLDHDALAKAISDDDDYYEDKALKMGVSTETAKKMDQEERQMAREKRDKARNLEEQKIQNHFLDLQRQGEEMKKVFPSFDLNAELKNPVFFRMTAPNSGLSVEDAYYAVHRKELQVAAMQVAAQKTAQKVSYAIQSGSRRPDEAGTSAQAPSVTTFDYRAKSAAERQAFKDFLRSEAAQGRKVYPGQR